MQAPRLDALYARLRAEGLTVGVAERLRIEALVAALGAPDRDTLRAVLAAVVVKSKHDIPRFEHAFDLWSPADEPHEPRATRSRPVATRRRPRWHIRAVIGLALSLALIAVAWLTHAIDPAPEPPIQYSTLARVVPFDQQYATSYFERTATIRPGEPTAPDRKWDAGLLIGAFALLGAAIWRATRRPPSLPTSDALRPEDPAPTPLEALPDPRPTDRLLGRGGREAMVWGIDHFAGERSTTHIDLPASVGATLRAGGMPTVVHTRHRHAREVWLWIDDLAAHARPEIDRLADEIARALRGAGLPFEIARFDGVPDTLVTTDGERFSPAEIDARRDVARVAVLTDGRWLMARARPRGDHRPAAIVRLLRTLAHWPAVAFADFARDAHGLGALLTGFGLEDIAPEAVASWLGGEPRFVPYDATDVRLWAGACALCPDPLDRTTALQLRDTLGAAGLHADAWALPALIDDARQRGAIRWSLADARARVAHLRAVESGPSSLFTVAARFWRDRWQALADADVGPVDREHRRAHLALMQLWLGEPTAIAAAAETLVALRDRLQPEVAERLHHMCPAVAGATPADAFALPWVWEDQPPMTRRRLREAGLAKAFATLEAESLRPASRYWTAAGAAAALALVALVGLLTAVVRPPSGPPTCDGVPLCRPIGEVEGQWSVLVGDSRAWRVDRAPPGAVIELAAAVEAPCQEDIGGYVALRCGRTSTPVAPAASGWPSRSVAIVRQPITDEDTRARIANLIDHGALHVAFFVDGSPDAGTGTAPSDLLGHIDRADQVLLVSESPPVEATTWAPAASAWLPLAALPAADAGLGGTPTPITRALPEARVLTGDPVMLPRADERRDCPYREQTVDGMTYVQVCGGTFAMGSADGDPDERPVYDVTLSGFWMGKYEVSNAQYRAAGHPEHQAGEPPDWPATRVNWQEAGAYCASIGANLPTEAQWEYAARGRDGRVHPWGDQEPTHERAVFGAEDPEPIGSRPGGAGPFGTLDQAGNAWEWVADCYDTYRQVDDIDLRVDNPACGRRVLRGGGFGSGARDLRAADRDRNSPEGRGPVIGFRCARLVRPEPTVAP